MNNNYFINNKHINTIHAHVCASILFIILITVVEQYSLNFLCYQSSKHCFSFEYISLYDIDIDKNDGIPESDVCVDAILMQGMCLSCINSTKVVSLFKIKWSIFIFCQFLSFGNFDVLQFSHFSFCFPIFFIK